MNDIVKFFCNLSIYSLSKSDRSEIQAIDDSKTNQVDDSFIMVTLSIVCKIFSGSHKSYNIL